MGEPRSRSEPHFHNVDELEWEPRSGTGVLDGLDVRLLSRDSAKGSSTWMARLPPSWRARADSDEAALEIFVLEGDLAADGEAVGAGGFVALPRGAGSCELTSRAGAQAYVFSSSTVLAADSYEGRLHVRRVWQEQWIIGDVPGIRNGRLYKPLRVPDMRGDGLEGGPGGLLHLVLQLPGFRLADLEVHGCWEEAIVLAGDNLMLGRGSFSPQTYIGNPAGHVHGVMMTQRGTLLLRHTDAPLDVEYTTCPVAGELIAGYLDTTSFLDEPATVPWSSRPEARAFPADGQRTE